MLLELSLCTLRFLKSHIYVRELVYKFYINFPRSWTAFSIINLESVCFLSSIELYVKNKLKGCCIEIFLAKQKVPAYLFVQEFCRSPYRVFTNLGRLFYFKIIRNVIVSVAKVHNTQ